MAPEWLQSTYKQYKADTSTFTSWLLQSAIDLGYRVKEPGPNIRNSKLKGLKESQITIKVTVSELLNIANFLVARPTILVPEDIVTVAQRALKARKECRDWYKITFAGCNAPESSVLEQENLGHEHFIRALTAVLDTLKPLFATKEAPLDPPSSRKSKPEINNIFELLEVDVHHDGDAIGSSESVIHQHKTNDEPKQNSREGETKSTWLFQAFCTIQDFNEIRNHVSQLWRCYRNGTVDLITASAVTEVAFHLMEDIERANLFLEVDGKLLNPVQVAEQFLTHCSYIRGCQLKVVEPGPMWDIAQWLCLSMKPQIDLWTSGEAPQSKILRRAYGEYDPSANRSSMSASEKYCEDCTILSHILFDTSILEKFRIIGFGVFIQDQVTTIIAQMGKADSQAAGTTSLWLCFGVQILLDIHIVLRTDVTRPCKQMRVVAGVSRAIIKDYSQFLRSSSIKSLNREQWSSGDDEDLRGLEPILFGIEVDLLSTLKHAVYDQQGLNKNDYEAIQDSPFSQNPVLCGLDILGIYLCLEEEGIRFADHWWSIMPMAHLYNALRQEKCLLTVWPQMEKLIEIHTPEYIFYGGRSPNLQTCHSKVRLAKGLAADMNSPDARSSKVGRNKPKRTFVSNLSPMSIYFRQNLLRPRRGPDGAKELKIDFVNSLHQMYHTQLEKRDKKALGKPFRSLDLLNFVEHDLSKELAGIKFNYWALHQECIKILRLLRLEFMSIWKQAGVQGYDSDEASSLLHVSEDLIMLGVAQTRNGTSKSSAFQRAAVILEGSLKKK